MYTLVLMAVTISLLFAILFMYLMMVIGISQYIGTRHNQMVKFLFTTAIFWNNIKHVSITKYSS